MSVGQNYDIKTALMQLASLKIQQVANLNSVFNELIFVLVYRRDKYCCVGICSWEPEVLLNL